MFRSLIIVTALVCGGSAAMLVKMSVPATATAEGAQTAAELVTVQVLSATQPIEEGAEIKVEDLGWIDWPQAAVNPGFIQKSLTPEGLDGAVGQIARSNFFPGQPLLSEGLADSRQGYLSSLLTPGMRAVAIEISAAKTAGGFILPNNRVDILMTSVCSDALLCRHSMRTETILQNVRVLAIDQSGTGPSSENTVLVGKTATLELSPDDAEQVIAAEASGALSLLLRSAEDNVVVEPKREVARLEPQVELAPEPRTVKVNRGGVSEIVVLN